VRYENAHMDDEYLIDGSESAKKLRSESSYFDIYNWIKISARSECSYDDYNLHYKDFKYLKDRSESTRKFSLIWVYP